MNIQEEQKQLHILDDALADMAKHLHLYKFLTPTNLETERRVFLEKNGDYNPQFTYAFPEEETLLAIITKLKDMKESFFGHADYTLPIHRLLEEKIDENIIKSELLIAYIHQDFPAIEKYNTALFGTFDQDLLTKSEHILQTCKDPDPTIRGKKLTNDEVIQYIEQYLKQEQISDIQLKIIPFSMNKFLMTFGQKHCRLIFSQQLQTREQELQANLIHEIQVHYKRYENGRTSGRKILSYGTAHYAAVEEGLALYEMCGYQRKQYPGFEKRSIYQKYILLQYGQGKSFVDIVQYILSRGMTNNLKKIFTMVANMKRGIQDTGKKTIGNTFIKNKIYAEGLENVTQRIAHGNDKSLLYQGKIKIGDLPYLPR